VLEYARSQAVFILRYLRLTVWPHPLVLDYGTELVSDPWQYVPATLVVAALAAGALWAVVRRPRAGLLAFLFFALLAPTSSVVPVATQTAAEHRMYLPLAPLVVLAVVGSVVVGDRWRGSRGTRWVVGGWVVVALLLAGGTYVRNEDYRSERVIWEDVAAKRPNNARAFVWNAICAERANEPEVAEQEYRKAIQLAPTRSLWQHFGTFLLHRGRIDDVRGSREGRRLWRRVRGAGVVSYRDR
jgi:protein O-mannosyl-transferase